jgi:hypothetical protein
MRFLIQSIHPTDTKRNYSFLIYLCKYLKEVANSTLINPGVEKLWNDQLSIYNVTLKELIDLYFNNLVFNKLGNQDVYYIQCDPIIKVKDSNITVDVLANYVNKGNIDIKGSKIFTNIYQQMLLNLHKLYNMWRFRN